jgi:hypothetical protein
VKGDDSRSAILRRRAAFLSSALAACTPATASTDGATRPPVVTLPPATNSVAPQPTASVAQPPAPKPGVDPRYDIPTGLSPQAAHKYEQLYDAMKHVHGQLDEVDAKLPACDINKSPDCERLFREVATHLNDVDNTMRLLYIGPGTSDEAMAFEPIKLAQLELVRARIERTKKAVDDKAGAGLKTWVRIQADVAQAHAVPCLSFACPDW